MAGDIPVRLLPGVDATIRASFSEDGGAGWPQLAPAQVDELSRATEGWGLMAVAACHRSGFVREAALKALAASAEGRAVSFVLVRLNDWVQPVHAAARAALEQFLSPPFAAHLISALPLVWMLARQKRADHRDVVAHVFALLRSPECAAAVRVGCRAPEFDIRRTCFEIQLGGARRSADVLGEALSNREPAVRLWAARKAAEEFPVAWAESLVRQALEDRSVQVRRVALGALAPSLPEAQARELIEAALLDTNGSARWQARALSLQRGPFDFAAFYRRALAAAMRPSAVRGALMGLGESGEPNDVVLLAPFLTADGLAVRCAALRARATLEPLSMIDPYLAALRLPEPSVSREARRALQARLPQVPLPVLGALLADQKLPVHSRRNALLLVNGKSKWKRLALLLDACADPDVTIAKSAVLFIDGWCVRYNRSFLQPTPAQIAAASAAFSRVSPRLREHVREIGHILEVFVRGAAG